MFTAVVLLLVATLADASRQQFPMSVARPYVESEVQARRGVSQLPSNVVLASPLRPLVERMLQRSATFRRQCGRIGRTSALVVTVHYAVRMDRNQTGDAMTQVRRRADGGIEATVSLSALGNPVELIAHEFEHVLEQVDEVDLPAMAARPATGVRMVSAGRNFETDRAIVIGRQVADEVRLAVR